MPKCFFCGRDFDEAAKRIVAALYETFTYENALREDLLSKTRKAFEEFQRIFSSTAFIYKGKYVYLDIRDFEVCILWGLKKGKLRGHFTFDSLLGNEGLELKALIRLYYSTLEGKWAQCLDRECNEDYSFLRDGIVRPGNFILEKRYNWLYLVYKLYYSYLGVIPNDYSLEVFVDTLPLFWTWLLKQGGICGVSFFERLVAYSITYFIPYPSNWSGLIKEKILFDINNGTFNEKAYPLRIRI